jgi:hypothetical protein
MGRVVLDPPEVTVLLSSGRLPTRDLCSPAGMVALVDPDGDLIALAESRGEAGLQLKRVFPR